MACTTRITVDTAQLTPLLGWPYKWDSVHSLSPCHLCGSTLVIGVDQMEVLYKVETVVTEENDRLIYDHGASLCGYQKRCIYGAAESTGPGLRWI